MRVIEGQLSAAGLKFGIVAGRFNSFISEQLISGAIDALVRHGASKSDLTLIRVPGSFEIPLTCKKLADSASVDAIVAVGAVLRGATLHYELVCKELAKGLADVSRDSSLPITFGVITADTIEQAVERAGTKAGNKGAEAAMAAIEMVQVLRQLESSRR